MSDLLTELTTALTPILPVETGFFSAQPPDEYYTLTPITDTFDLHADDSPGYDVQSIRVSLYTRGNYTQRKRQTIRAFLSTGAFVVSCMYVEFEPDTGYHHYAFDCEKQYHLEVP
jgi:hypothetical protein